MTDDRQRTLRAYGPLLLLALIVPVTVLVAGEQWRLSAEVVRLERLVRDFDARQQSAINYVNGRHQELASDIEELRLKDRAYFPPNAFGKDDERAGAFARQLRGLKADSFPALAEAKDAGTTARLLWLPADGRPTAVRLLPPDRSNTWARLEVAQVAGPNPAGTGKVVKGAIALLPEHAMDLDRRLDKVRLWSAPGIVEGGVGGKGRWILEGVKEGRYHLLAGGSEADPAFQEVGRFLLGIAKMIQNQGLLIP